MKVGFIGLGNMGLAMATNLVKSGQQLQVFNRTRSAAAELERSGVPVAASAAALAADIEVLITMLANDQAVEAILFGQPDAPGALAALKPGTIHISMSTISPDLSGRLAQAHAAGGQAYLAAPVFGRPDAAAKAQLRIVVAGAAAAIERCRVLFEAMGQQIFVVGEDPPQANIVKIAGNFLIASALEAMAEAFTLARKHDISAAQLLAIVNGSLFRSPLYENYGGIIAEERFEPAGFALRLGLKDVRLVLDAAEAATSPMPLASLLRDRFLAALASGYGDLDWSALSRVSADQAGLPSVIPPASS